MCDGACVSGGSEVNCSACGHVCRSDDVPHSRPVCIVGNCTWVCTTGFGDCDLTGANGCEVDVRTSPSHCGRCYRACPGGAPCVGGRCVEQRSCQGGDGGIPGCGLVEIPGGEFTMGDPDPATGDAGNSSPRQPNIRVSAFVMDRYEVTVARFRRFWNATDAGTGASGGVLNYPGDASVSLPDGAGAPSGRSPPDAAGTDHSRMCNWTSEPGDREGHPLNCITWHTAQAFCLWDGGRLPTEAEWEFAARGADPGATRRPWPWGESFDGTRLCWNGCPPSPPRPNESIEGCTGTCPEEGTYDGGISPFGVWHMAGNVYEWVADGYAPYGDSRCWGTRDGGQQDPLCNNGGDREVRGGSWITDTPLLHRSTTRSNHGTNGNNIIGLRCARSR